MPARLLTACVVLAFAPANALASEVDRFSPGAGAVGSGGLSLLSADPAVLATNPAAAARLPSGASFGLDLAWPNATITLGARPAGVDVLPSTLVAEPIGGWPAGAVRPLATSSLVPRANTTGVAPSHTLLFAATAHFFSDRGALGVALQAPISAIQAQQSFYTDEREQFFTNRLHWMALGGDQRQLAVSASAAWRVTDGVAIGIGAFFDQVIGSDARVYMPRALSSSDGQMNIANQVLLSSAPTAGASLGPWNGARLEVAWHGARETRIDVDSLTRLRGLDNDGSDSTTLSTRFRLAQIPQQAVFEASWTDASDVWSLGAGARWQRWSATTTAHDEPIPGGLSDVVDLHAGARWRLPNGMWLRAGGAFTPSPVPEQTGRANVVDNDRVTGTAGFGFTTSVDLGRLDVELAGRLVRLIARHNTKMADAASPVYDELPAGTSPKTGQIVPETRGFQTNNPGFPGFGSGGWLGALTLSVALRR